MQNKVKLGLTIAGWLAAIPMIGQVTGSAVAENAAGNVAPELVEIIIYVASALVGWLARWLATKKKSE